MSFLAQVVVWLNAIANAAGKWLLAPIGVLPGWLSATAVAAVTGVLLLAVFKYTSNQRAIKRVRDDIKAHLLVLKLFKDSALVVVRAQGRVFAGAFWLLVFSLVPMAVMLVPVMLILGQLALWYQSRPLQVGEKAVLTLKLQDGAGDPWPAVSLQPTDAIEVAVGPVRVQSKREICWSLRAREGGYHRLAFQVGDETIDKELAVGDSFMRVSAKRPGWIWSDALLHPWEKPLAPDSPVQWVEIDYPARSSWTSGTNYWMIYWFVVSMVAALCFRRVLNVNI